MSGDAVTKPRRVPPRIGPLEMAVLDALWAAGAQNVAEMQRTVGEPRGVSRNTIHSTLERLVRKRLAARRKIGRAYEYRALVSRTDWIARSLAAVLDFVPGDDPAQMFAGFVEAAERTGAEHLAVLERIVRNRRRALERARAQTPAPRETTAENDRASGAREPEDPQR
jgi:predicted transcriptional regulator